MRPRVLVIDDDDTVCELLREALTLDGYAVATVPHGAAALELVQHHRPAVILCDLLMPVMDGRSFIERYRAAAATPASLLLLSARPDLELVGVELGADGVIQKPFELDRVSAAVARCLALT